MQRPFLSVLLLSLSASATRAQEPSSPLLDSFPQYLQSKQESEFGLQWVSLGPVLNSARVEAVQGDPSSPGTMYVAFGSGNLWKTVNAGLTWQPIFEGQSALGIGDIASNNLDGQRLEPRSIAARSDQGANRAFAYAELPDNVAPKKPRRPGH